MYGFATTEIDVAKAITGIIVPVCIFQLQINSIAVRRFVD